MNGKQESKMHLVIWEVNSREIAKSTVLSVERKSMKVRGIEFAEFFS